MSNALKDSLKDKLLHLECHFTWSIKKEIFDFDEARRRLEELIVDGVKYQAMPYNYLAFITCLQGNYKEALENLQKAEEILHKNHEHDFERRSIITYGNFAWVYYHMDQLTDVQTYLDRLERICKLFANASRYAVTTPEIYGEKGWALLNSAGLYYEEANKCFLKALEEDPDDTEWNMGYATVLYRLESFFGTAESLTPGKAILQLQRVLELDPDDSIAMVLLALKLREVGKVNEGFTLVEKAMNISPNRPYVIRYAAIFLRKADAIDEAVKLLERAMTITPEAAFLHHQIGLCYRVKLYELNKHPGSRNTDFEGRAELIELCKHHFQKAFLIKPSFISAQLDFADICSMNEEQHKAEEIYMNLLKVEQIRPENKQYILLKVGLHEMYQKRNDLKAADFFLKGMKVLCKSDDREKCSQNLKKIVQKRLCRNPRDCIAFGFLGFMHQLDGEKPQAVEYFEKALKFDPNNEEYLSALYELRLTI